MASITDNFHKISATQYVRTSVPQINYSDNVGHLLRTRTWGFNTSQSIVADQRYDELGRLWEVDQPHFDTVDAELARRLSYDVVGRVTGVSTPDSVGTLQTATTIYGGLVTTLINLKKQKRVETRDAIGQLTEVWQVHTDAGSVDTYTRFKYDPYSNLTSTTDPSGNIISVLYDKLGRKERLTDPDLGVINYKVDPLGRTWKQINPVEAAAATATVFGYDQLGRMTSRIERDLKSYWVYDQQAGGNCKLAKSCGKLVEAYTLAGLTKDYDRFHSYDDFGRPKSTQQTINEGDGNATYKNDTAYDDWGRIIRQTYQRNTDTAKVFDSRYNNAGVLERLERGSMVLWRTTAQDAASRLKSSALGNGLSQAFGYEPYTGRLKNTALAASTSLPVLAEGYSYDLLGNVMLRSQHWDTGGFDETFTYDDLNRLSTSSVPTRGSQTYTYDLSGNLKTKTGVGMTGATYVYPAPNSATPRPHAVSSISGVGSFTYNANGNMLSGAGRVYTWNNFDMPVTITKTAGAFSSSFVYGPEHQRTRQTRGDSSVQTYAGAQEVETTPAGKLVRTYWPYGVGVEIDRPGKSTELNWVHRDRLGSTVLITGQTGSVVEKMAHDAWGKRRALDGTNSTPDSIDGKTDNKGFTGHEMLDQLDLVHMNGRVYDPLIAKFVSADPVVQEVTNGQNYNRYSYVLNNPTNLTDPTGFKWDPCGIYCDTVYQAGQTDSAANVQNARGICAQGCNVTVSGFGDEDGNYEITQFGAGAAIAKMGGIPANNSIKYDANGNELPGSGTPLAAISTQQRALLVTALGNAQKLAREKVQSMKAGKADASMEKFFYSSSKSMYEKLIPTAEALSTRLDSLTANSFLPSSACMPGCAKGARDETAGAFVIGSGKENPNIYINSVAFNTQSWTLTRIIVHETSHLWNGGATHDWKTYGIRASLKLRDDAPRAAQSHADTWSFFITGDSK